MKFQAEQSTVLNAVMKSVRQKAITRMTNGFTLAVMHEAGHIN